MTANVSNTVGLVPGSLSGGDRLPRASWPASARGCCGSASASLVGGIAGALLLLVLPAAAFDAIVPVLIGLGCVLVVLQPADLERGSRPAPSRAAACRPRRLAGCGRRCCCAGVYGGYFGAAQGVLLMAILGIGLAETMQRHNATKNVLAALVNGVAAVVFIFVADVDWRAAALIAVGSIIGGQIGATVGRRLPAAVLRGVIVVVGVVAIVSLLLG